MSKKSLPTPRKTQTAADALKATIAHDQHTTKHRSSKSGRYKVPLHPDGKTPLPAEEGGLSTDDVTP